MHIAFVTYEFVTTKVCGGLGHYIANISRILAEHGNKVTIFLVSNYDKSFVWEENITVISFVANKIGKHTRKWEFVDVVINEKFSHLLTKSENVNKKIAEYNVVNPIDIIQYCGDDLAIWYRNKKIPSVIRLSSFMPLWLALNKRDYDLNDESWLHEWNSRFYFCSFMKADAIYSPSRFISSLVKSKIPKNVKVIESPCIVRKEIHFEQKYNETLKDKRYLLFFGSLNPLKGIHVIKDSLQPILRQCPEILFVLAGRAEGEIVNTLKNAAGKYSDRVIYLGEIRDPETLYGVIQNAFACVLPSRADNLPNTCIEAMGLGKIVIGTYGASFEQLIKHKQSGLLIKRDSSKALIKAVDYLMQMSVDERKTMEKKAEGRIKEMYPDVIYKQLITFYQYVISKKKKHF